LSPNLKTQVKKRDVKQTDKTVYNAQSKDHKIKDIETFPTALVVKMSFVAIFQKNTS
jgi:hypothetical protein